MQSQLINIDGHANRGLGNGQLMTIRQFCKVFPWPSESAMRAYVYRARELNICAAFVRVGRRVLVAPENFFELIKEIGSLGKKDNTAGLMQGEKGGC